MIAPIKRRSRRPTPDWHADFLRTLPIIAPESYFVDSSARRGKRLSSPIKGCRESRIFRPGGYNRGGGSLLLRPGTVMAIRVVCSHCENSCSLPDSLSGKGMDCPACGHFIAVPTASGGATPPPLTAASLLDLMDQGRGPGWSSPSGAQTAETDAADGLVGRVRRTVVVAADRSRCGTAEERMPARGRRGTAQRERASAKDSRQGAATRLFPAATGPAPCWPARITLINTCSPGCFASMASRKSSAVLIGRPSTATIKSAAARSTV